jgi:hypothetical protein
MFGAGQMAEPLAGHVQSREKVKENIFVCGRVRIILGWTFIPMN